MIISKTPFRISLFGGGTDYPIWYKEHGGMVIGTTINKYCYLSVSQLSPYFNHKYRIIWSRIEDVNKISEIQHPAVRAALTFLNINEGLEISYRGDLPARSGLGTSSSFAVGIMNALYALLGPRPSSNELANIAIYLEQEVLKETVGCQDQIWAAYGGFNQIIFHRDSNYVVIPLSIRNSKELERSFMLFFTGFTRTASDIAERLVRDISKQQKVSLLHRIADICKEAKQVLEQQTDTTNDISDLLHESWILKKQLTDGITTPLIDEIYEAGLKAGALGGKLLGAGGGGFILFIVNPGQQYNVRKCLHKLIHVPIKISNEGSKILVMEP